MLSVAPEHLEGPANQDSIVGVNLMTQKVVASAVSLSKAGHDLDSALIDDEIEQQLMREGFFRVAKEYILASSCERRAHFLNTEQHFPKKKNNNVISRSPYIDGKTGKITETSSPHRSNSPAVDWKTSSP